MAPGGDDPICEGRPAGYWIGSLIYNLMRPEATEALCRSGQKVVPALVQALKHSNHRICEEAAQVLKKIDPETAAKAGVK